MQFISTRGQAPKIHFSAALSAGLAPDGGLFVPEEIPQIDWRPLVDKFATDVPGSFAKIALATLAPFFAGDPLQPHLPEIVSRAFNFPLILRRLKSNTAVLELFHGPTCAFKDFGARFLAEAMAHLDQDLVTPRESSTAQNHAFDLDPQPFAPTQRTILVATSGDTGGAVAAAFHGQRNVQVGVLFPKGKVSRRQEQQLTCWGGNIHSFAVRGSFDDCQKMVKDAFQDRRWQSSKGLTSANSINLGRLLPQITYYAAASLWHLQQHSESPTFVIPSGNLGNAVAAFYAKKMGFPMAKIILATNQNQTVSDYFATGEWRPRPSVVTLANAMDVGNPSNMERLRFLYPQLSDLSKDAQASWVSDEEIRSTIRRGPQDWGQVWCPHTATAVATGERLARGPWIIVATAHPAKFETIVEPLIGQEVEIPSALKELLNRPTNFVEIDPDLAQLKM